MKDAKRWLTFQTVPRQWLFVRTFGQEGSAFQLSKLSSISSSHATRLEKRLIRKHTLIELVELLILVRLIAFVHKQLIFCCLLILSMTFYFTGHRGIIISLVDGSEADLLSELRNFHIISELSMWIQSVWLVTNPKFHFISKKKQ